MTGPRFSRPGDEGGLRALWKRVFADSDLFLDTFFREIYVPGMAAVMEDGGTIVSAAYCIPFGMARYIYAVATAPEHRGRGCGKAVTLFAADGKDAYLCPASKELRRWYMDAMGALPASIRPAFTPTGALKPIPAEEYVRRREALLERVPHAEYSPGILALFALDGGFFEDEAGHICAVDREGSVRELLPCPPGGQIFLLALNGAPPIYWGLTLD
ncbi:MAG: GNAT family N-acetyltransferase [Oscillospiraceae bacterium]|nr:GNAT family N-acetyltransferase [Oscillospiraceae bacterium]